MLRPSFCLPDLLCDWPYSRQLNPHGTEVSAASSEWICSYNLFNKKSERAFKLCNSGLLAALSYPYADKAQLRVVCDALNFVFVFDDYSDTQSPRAARELCENIMEAFRDPHGPLQMDRCILADVVRSFWSRAIETISPSCARRFVEAFDQYSQAIVQQAEDRARNYVRDMDNYLILRRETIGAKLAFALLEDGFDFPPETLEHPIILELTNYAIDIISLSNDVYSYNVEQSRGDDAHNMVTCIMRDKNLNISGAMHAMETLINSLASKFLAVKEAAPKWEDEAINAHLARYIDGMGIWVRANSAWSFESQRYFGPEGLQIQQHRVVMLRPKQLAV